MNCPRCGSPEVRHSRRSSFSEYVAGLFLFRPYRCRRCMNRFFSSQERLRKIRYARCPRCGNHDLQTISKRHVPVRWFRGIQHLIHRRAYRCDGCRWRFFDARRLAPKPAQAAPPPDARAATGA